jgi:hypothetical protein
MSYKVYLNEYIGAPRNHQAIFVETNSDGSGYIFQVTGNIQTGMTFGHKAANEPEKSQTFVSREYIGTVTEVNYDRIQGIVEQVEPPKKQFNGPTRLYPGEALRRCQEWTAEAIQALKDAGIIEN